MTNFHDRSGNIKSEFDFSIFYTGGEGRGVTNLLNMSRGSDKSHFVLVLFIFCIIIVVFDFLSWRCEYILHSQCFFVCICSKLLWFILGVEWLVIVGLFSSGILREEM